MSEFRWPFRRPRDLVEELYQACLWEDKIPIEAAYKAADWLFTELIQRIDVKDARAVFLRAIDEVTDEAKDHEDRMLLLRLKRMRDKKTGKRKPNVQRLAAAIVAENEAFNKSPERKGAPARSTNQPSIEKYIRRLRDAEIEAAQEQNPQPRQQEKTARKIA
jgi:hypothetical protein